MLRLISWVAPHMLGVVTNKDKRSVLAEFSGYGLVVLGVMMAIVSIYLLLVRFFDVLIASALMSSLLLAVGLSLILVSRLKPQQAKELPSSIANDPVAKYIPENIKNEPVIKHLLETVSDNPVAASASAVTIGMLLAREL